jgi:hypothetical protein
VRFPWSRERPSRLEQAWSEREEVRYPEMFGGEGEGIFPLSLDLFCDVFGQKDVDPRWLHLGVFRFAPTPDRPTWLCVSSGLSNDWEEECRSGFGHELVLETPWKSDAAISTLRYLVAYDLLLAHGRYGEPRLLEVGSRVHANLVLDDHGSMEGMLITEACPSSFSVSSGPVELLACVGVTASELAFAKVEGSDALIYRLGEAGVHNLTDPRRPSIV